MAVTGKWYVNNIITALNKRQKGANKMNYTKGPWVALKEYFEPAVYTKLGNGCRGTTICRLKEHSEEMAANAQLISASPDLYEALNALVRHANCEPGQITEELWEQAEKALQKAEGRE